MSARVREELWKRVRENTKTGRATMVFNANNEQRMDFRVHNTEWEPIDFDGLKLMLRPGPERKRGHAELRLGFSNAARLHTARQMSSRKHGGELLPERYVVVDIETNGLSTAEHEIIEIGAILVSDKKIEAEYHSLVKPAASIPLFIRDLTGLTDEILDHDGREPATVLKEFLAFTGNLPVVSHNADFEYSFLRSACDRYALPLFSNRCIDTVALARRLVDDVKNYKLATLVDYFGIEVTGRHRSIADCLTTKQLYEKLIELR
jgi:CRISPR-associated protein Cas2